MIALKIRKGVSLGLGSPPLLPPFLHLPLPCLARSPTGFSVLRGIFLFLASAKKEKLSLSRRFFLVVSVRSDGHELVGGLWEGFSSSGAAGVSARRRILFFFSTVARQVVLSRWLTLPIPRASGQAEEICGDPALGFFFLGGPCWLR